MNQMQTLEKESSDPKVQTGGEEKTKKHHILLVNLLGFTRLSPKKDPHEIAEVQNAFSAIVNSTVAIFRGNVIKNAGYAYLATFDTAADVLRAGLKIESGVFRHNQKDGRPGLEVKLAITTDEPVLSERWGGEVFKSPAAPKKEFLAENGNGKIHIVAPAPVKREPAPEHKAVKPQAKPAPRREIRIPIPDIVVEAYGLGIAAVRFDVFKTADRIFWTALFASALALAGLRISWVNYPVIPAFIQDQSVHPAGIVAGWVNAEIARNRLASMLKKPISAITAPMKPSSQRPEPQLTTVTIAESEAPSVVKTPPVVEKPVMPIVPPPAVARRADPPQTAPESFKDGLEMEKWFPVHSEKAAVTVDFVPQNQGQAARMKYDLGGTDGWAQIHRTLWIEKLEKEAIVFYYKATGSANDLEIKISDDDGTNFGYRLTFNPDGAWHRVKIPFKDFTYWWGGNSTLSYASKLYFAVSPGTGGSGELLIDQVKVAWID